MGCEWKSADGKYCRFCEAFEYGKIEELEAYVGERCNDHFTTCPIAYAFCPPEEWDEGANGSDNDRKSDYESSELNNYESPLTFDPDDEDHDYSGSCHGDRRGSVFSFHIQDN